MITVSQINELRQQTQVSMLLCKQALEATDGDMNRAKEWLRSKGSEVAGDGGSFRYSLFEDAAENLQGVTECGKGFQWTDGVVSIDIRGFDGSSPRTMWGSDRRMLVCRPVKA